MALKSAPFSHGVTASPSEREREVDDQQQRRTTRRLGVGPQGEHRPRGQHADHDHGGGGVLEAVAAVEVEADHVGEQQRPEDAEGLEQAALYGARRRVVVGRQERPGQDACFCSSAGPGSATGSSATSFLALAASSLAFEA